MNDEGNILTDKDLKHIEKNVFEKLKHLGVTELSMRVVGGSSGSNSNDFSEEEEE